jgi:hypothetical protein
VERRPDLRNPATTLSLEALRGMQEMAKKDRCASSFEK